MSMNLMRALLGYTPAPRQYSDDVIAAPRSRGQQLVGAVEILGTEDDLVAGDLLGVDILGKHKHRHHGHHGHRPHYAQQHGIVHEAPSIARRGYLGMGRLTAAAVAGATVTLLGRPQKTFRIDRVLLTESTAADGLVLNFTAGVDPINVGTAGAPVAGFAATAFEVMMRGRTVTAGMDVSALIQSAAGNVTFAGMVYGEYVE